MRSFWLLKYPSMYVSWPPQSHRFSIRSPRSFTYELSTSTVFCVQERFDNPNANVKRFWGAANQCKTCFWCHEQGSLQRWSNASRSSPTRFFPSTKLSTLCVCVLNVDEAFSPTNDEDFVFPFFKFLFQHYHIQSFLSDQSRSYWDFTSTRTPKITENAMNNTYNHINHVWAGRKNKTTNKSFVQKEQPTEITFFSSYQSCLYVWKNTLKT